jgi:hypothetical protein
VENDDDCAGLPESLPGVSSGGEETTEEPMDDVDQIKHPSRVLFLRSVPQAAVVSRSGCRRPPATSGRC